MEFVLLFMKGGENNYQQFLLKLFLNFGILLTILYSGLHELNSQLWSVEESCSVTGAGDELR